MPVAIDFETALIQAGLLAPPPSVLTWADETGAGLVPSSDGWRHQEAFLAALLDSTERIVGFNVAFDFGVALSWWPSLTDRIFAAYDAGRVHEIQVAERLGEIAKGRPAKHANLEDLSRAYGVAELDKADSPRLDYARFIGATELPQAHRDYAIGDSVATHRLYRAVRARYGTLINDAAIESETRAAFWLHLCAARGLRVNPDRLEELRRDSIERQGRLLEMATLAGFVRADGSRDMKRIKAAVAKAYGVPCGWVRGKENARRCEISWEPSGAIPSRIRTEAGGVGTGKEVLLDSDDPDLVAFAEWGEVTGDLSRVIPMLENGTVAPIHTSYRMADTTRTTSRRGDVAGGNMQNFGRKGGSRACLEPRDGYEFGEADVTGLEMGTLAQVLCWTVNKRSLADRLNAGSDEHVRTAAALRGTTYDRMLAAYESGDKAADQDRQLCKVPNFGYPGGMGEETLISFARGQLPRERWIDLPMATALKVAWRKTNPDTANDYLRGYIRTLENAEGTYDHLIPGSPGIWRRGVGFCAAANGHFQGLGAQAMKRAGWILMREAWTDRQSPLHVSRGARMASFVHDSFFYEIPIGWSHEVLTRVAELMVEELTRSLPDVRMKVKPVAMRLWSKDAFQVKDPNTGRIIAWEPGMQKSKAA